MYSSWFIFTMPYQLIQYITYLGHVPAHISLYWRAPGYLQYALTPLQITVSLQVHASETKTGTGRLATVYS